MSIETIRDHADIVIDNTANTTRREWLDLRTEGIGGSDAAAAVGLSPYESPYSLWASKTGLVGEKEETDPMRWGNRLEEAIGMGFATDTGIEVVRYPVMLRSKQYPWAQVNLDFLTADGEGVVECKNVGLYQLDSWEDGKVPGHYGLQGQHELAVTGLDVLWFAALIGGQNPRYIKVERNQTLIEDLMEQERQFWELVKANTPPAIDGSEATTKALKEQYAEPAEGSMVEVDPVVMTELLRTRADLKADEKYTKARLDVVENSIRSILGDAEVGTVEGVPAVTWKVSHVTRVSSDKLREKYPDIAEECSTITAQRTIRVPKNSPLT